MSEKKHETMIKHTELDGNVTRIEVLYEVTDKVKFWDVSDGYDMQFRRVDYDPADDELKWFPETITEWYSIARAEAYLSVGDTVRFVFLRHHDNGHTPMYSNC